MDTLTIVVLIFVLLLLFGVYVYNRLVTLRVRTKESLSDIDTQLKRRYDLIPNLVNTVKGYAQHEKDVFTKVAELRSAAMQQQGTEKAQTENQISEALKSVFALAENYPELKANQNFLALQQELSDTENKLQAARRFYNVNVMAYNTALQVFPNNLLADFFHFQPTDFFEVENEQERQVVQVASKM